MVSQDVQLRLLILRENARDFSTSRESYRFQRPLKHFTLARARRDPQALQNEPRLDIITSNGADIWSVLLEMYVRNTYWDRG